MMPENKVEKLTATVLATSILYGCIAPQTYSWKTESVIKTEYQPIKQETVPEMRYEITSTLTNNGTLDIAVERNRYTVSYDLLTPINIERQREYSYGKSKVTTTFLNGGLGVLGVSGIFYGVAAITYNNVDCSWENPYPPAVCGTLDDLAPVWSATLLTGMITTAIAGSNYFNKPKKERPTKNYRELEVPLDIIERRKVAETKSEPISYIEHQLADGYDVPQIREALLKHKYTNDAVDEALKQATTNPTATINLQIKATAFTVNGQYTADVTTDENGHATVQLESTNPNFAFSVDELANTGVAKQLNKAGIPKQKYLPLLQNAAVPISYDVTIETKATDGENATETAHVSGYEIPQKALEGIIMGL